MIPAFTWLPPEINSALMFDGAGPGTLHLAASAWDGLASELSGAASSFDSVISGLTNGLWLGSSSVSMAAAAAPYVGWLNSAAGQAEAAATQARAAATAFETAQTATVPPAAVTANRVTLATLIATNFFGQNLPAIAQTEFQYLEMWAQDVAAMVGYHAGATSAAATLPSFSLPPVNLSGLGNMVSSALSGLEGELQSGLAGVVGVATQLGTQVQAVASELPLSDLSSVAQFAMYPASMLISPMIGLAQQGAGSAGLASSAAAAAPLAAAPKFVSSVPEMGGGGGGLGAVGAGLGKARLVGALSTPSTWQGSMPTGMGSSAMSGLASELQQLPAMAAAGGGAPPAGGGMPMMPMPMGGGMGAGGMPGGMLGRGGASPNTIQSRPSVVPRTGV